MLKNVVTSSERMMPAEPGRYLYKAPGKDWEIVVVNNWGGDLHANIGIHGKFVKDLLGEWHELPK